jgi:hypothetical protein
LELTACDAAAEDEGDDAAGHVLVDTGQALSFDLEPGLFANLAAEAVMDGLVERREAPMHRCRHG